MTAKYEFIDAQKATYPVTRMCAWLGVSRSGFYEWSSRPASATARRRQELGLLITQAFTDSDGTYGHRRVAAQLARWGVRASLEQVRALMRTLGLRACQPAPWRPVTTITADAGTTPDLLGRDFTATAPETNWSVTSPTSRPGTDWWNRSVGRPLRSLVRRRGHGSGQRPVGRRSRRPHQGPWDAWTTSRMRWSDSRLSWISSRVKLRAHLILP